VYIAIGKYNAPRAGIDAPHESGAAFDFVSFIDRSFLPILSIFQKHIFQTDENGDRNSRIEMMRPGKTQANDR
jgi:hypothetical protein